MSALDAGVLIATAWAVLGLSVSAARAWRRPIAAVTADAAGAPWRGVLYAFGRGMSPHAKESARDHAFVYAAGLTYHTAILVAASTVLLATFHVPSPEWVNVPAVVVLLVGASAGSVLLVRRATSPLLRDLSAADDYIANLLVDAWLLGAAATRAGVGPDTAPAFLVVSTMLGFYAPLGKIRHCVFFFLSRGLFGARLGRRGIVGR